MNKKYIAKVILENGDMIYFYSKNGGVVWEYDHWDGSRFIGLQINRIEMISNILPKIDLNISKKKEWVRFISRIKN